MILVIDNYDSFVFNLARYVRELGDAVEVIRNDVITVDDALAMKPAGIIISPGPCGPDEAGISTQLSRTAIANSIPLLGVCLGHQCLVAACGGTIIRANRPIHGQASAITHHGKDVFADLPSPMQVGRYHSLIADAALTEDLSVTARLEDDPSTIMAVAHKSAPAFGVQFHPESVLTDHGHALMNNFLGYTSRRAAERLAQTAE